MLVGEYYSKCFNSSKMEKIHIFEQERVPCNARLLVFASRMKLECTRACCGIGFKTGLIIPYDSLEATEVGHLLTPTI